MNILLIEDDLAIAALEQKILKGHNVRHAVNLHDAMSEKMLLAIDGGAVFDLVVLDLVLPKRDAPGEYRMPKEVLEIANERFKEIAVIVVSGFLDHDIMELIADHNMVGVDKSLLEDTDAFRYTFFSLAEVSRKMRTATFTEHLTTNAVKIAVKDNESSKDRTEARLYLMAGTTVILLPWLLIGYMMFSKSVLHDPDPIPYYTETLMFCGLAIAVILGIAPWIMKFLGKTKQ